MSDSGAELDEDLVFARQLLDAGRAEPLPSARTAAAFVTFATGLAALRGPEVAGSFAPDAAVSAAGSAARWAAAKWVTLGAVVGGAATFSWLEHRAPSTHVERAPLVAPPASAAAAPSLLAPVAVTSAGAPPAAHESEAEQPALSRAATRRRSATLRTEARLSGEAPRGSAAASPGLAAEVAALDGIRTALAIGAWGDAEQQLARYRREFAQGALRNEAEVLTISLLAAQGRKQAAANAAQTFLAANPRDPQAASVRALVR
jgi:hypothetical protein